MDPNAGNKMAHEEHAEQEEHGFIGKHLKKLKAQEDEKQRKIQEQKRFEDLQKYGEYSKLAVSQAGSQQVKMNPKKRGILARAQAKMEKELKDQ